jgi:hypothetical protein
LCQSLSEALGEARVAIELENTGAGGGQAVDLSR